MTLAHLSQRAVRWNGAWYLVVFSNISHLPECHFHCGSLITKNTQKLLLAKFTATKIPSVVFLQRNSHLFSRFLSVNTVFWIQTQTCVCDALIVGPRQTQIVAIMKETFAQRKKSQHKKWNQSPKNLMCFLTYM